MIQVSAASGIQKLLSRKWGKKSKKKTQHECTEEFEAFLSTSNCY